MKNLLRKSKIIRILYHYPGSIIKTYKSNRLIKKCAQKVKNTPDKIKRFQNIHLGKRCFIVCNGPSLTLEDLNKISGEYSFGSNRIYNMFPYTKWRPTYYCEADPYIAKIIDKRNMDMMLNECDACFLNLRSCDDYPNGTNKNTNAYFYYIKPIFGVESIKNETRLPDFSEDFSVYAYSGLTITYEMIQLAAYMGFKEMYIIGCDNNYKHTMETGKLIENKEVETNYPKEMGEPDNRIPKPTFNPKTTLAYKAAREYAEKHGIKIYNATRGGKLEVFERKTLEEVLGIE